MALVTGGALRLGRAIAIGLAQQGCDIGLHYRTSREAAEATADEVRGLGRQVQLFQADLSEENACRALVTELVATLGGLDVVVNSASHFLYDDATTFGHESLLAHMLPNLAAPILLANALAMHRRSGKGQARRLCGKLSLNDGAAEPPAAEPAAAEPAVAEPPAAEPAVVVNLLDQKIFNPNPDFLSYTLSKSALHAATTLLAQALAPQVRVVGVAPGLTLPSYLQDDDAFRRAHRDTSPLGRCSTVQDIVDAVLFAVNSRALTGSVLLVDGGQHLMPLARDVSFIQDGSARPAAPRDGGGST